MQTFSFLKTFEADILKQNYPRWTATSLCHSNFLKNKYKNKENTIYIIIF